MSVATEIRTWGETLVVKQCGQCGIHFAMPKLFDEECKKHPENMRWHCPNGHPRIYGISKADELQKEVTRLTARLDQKDAEIKYQREQRYSTERSLKATKGVVTKLKKRSAAGVCPCCNRTFKQLAQHMAGQHPEFVAEHAPVRPAAEIHKKVNARARKKAQA